MIAIHDSCTIIFEVMNKYKWASKKQSVVLDAKIAIWRLSNDIFIPGVHRGAHAATVALGLDPGKLLKFDFPSRTPKACSVRPCTWLCLLIVLYCILDGHSYSLTGDTLLNKYMYFLFASHFRDAFAGHCRCSCPASRSDHLTNAGDWLHTCRQPPESLASYLQDNNSCCYVIVVLRSKQIKERESSLENNYLMFKSVKRGKTNKIIPPIIKWQRFP